MFDNGTRFALTLGFQVLSRRAWQTSSLISSFFNQIARIRNNFTTVRIQFQLFHVAHGCFLI